MPTSGPGFISLQVRDVPRSAAFYEKYLGFDRQNGPPNAAVFGTTPASFAVRPPFEGVDLDSGVPLGLGVGIWMHSPQVEQVYSALVPTESRLPPSRSTVPSVARSPLLTSTATRSPSTTGPDPRHRGDHRVDTACTPN